MIERLYLQDTDSFEYDPAAVIAEGLAHVMYNGRLALLVVPVDESEAALSGVYSDPNRAVADILARDGERRYSLYARLQPVAASVSTTNCLRPGSTLNSEQIGGLARLLIDIDAPKPRDESPPGAEAVALACDVATLIFAVLQRAGVPRRAMSVLQSGYGVHLTVATQLSGCEADVQLWRDILGSLADSLSNRGLGGELIDQGVADLTRSTRIAGTMNVKYPDEPAPVWLLRRWGGETASLDVLEKLARRGRSIREDEALKRAAWQKQTGIFAKDYRPTWIRDLLRSGAPEGSRHEQCRRLVGWFVTYAPDEAEEAVAKFVVASRWDASEARAILRFYLRRTGKYAA